MFARCGCLLFRGIFNPPSTVKIRTFIQSRKSPRDVWIFGPHRTNKPHEASDIEGATAIHSHLFRKSWSNAVLLTRAPLFHRLPNMRCRPGRSSRRLCARLFPWRHPNIASRRPTSCARGRKSLTTLVSSSRNRETLHLVCTFTSGLIPKLCHEITATRLLHHVGRHGAFLVQSSGVTQSSTHYIQVNLVGLGYRG